MAAAVSASHDRVSCNKRPVKTALHQAVLDKRLHQVRLLVKRHFGNVDCQDVHGRSPLMLACLLDNEDEGLKMSKIFLAAGAYVVIRDNLGRTALHYACMKGKVRTVRRLLLSESVEVAAPDNDGNTPLIHAALSGNPAVVNLMLDVMQKFGISPDHRNNLGYTAILMACKYGHFVSAYALLTRAMASPTIRDNEFFLDALDWVKASPDIQGTYRQCPRKTRSAVDAPKFSRENTMYSQSSAPTCHHVANPTHPMGESLDAALRLPALFQTSWRRSDSMESDIDGRDARLLLFRELEQLLASPRYQPTRRVSRKSTLPGILRGRRQHPSTAKLLALDTGKDMFPNMRSLLDMYSEQYANWTMQRHPQSAPSSGKDRVTFADP